MEVELSQLSTSILKQPNKKRFLSPLHIKLIRRTKRTLKTSQAQYSAAGSDQNSAEESPVWVVSRPPAPADAAGSVALERPQMQCCVFFGSAV